MLKIEAKFFFFLVITILACFVFTKFDSRTEAGTGSEKSYKVRTVRTDVSGKKFYINVCDCNKNYKYTN